MVESVTNERKILALVSPLVPGCERLVAPCMGIHLLLPRCCLLLAQILHCQHVVLQANNPFVVRFYYSFSSPEKLFLVMEYCPGGDLSSLLQNIGRFDEDVARQYIAETVLALEYCHSKVQAVASMGISVSLLQHMACVHQQLLPLWQLWVDCC
eukprot:GHRR01030218.1.p1 GENE.GHRR01030218.1~~GHRR01030218.1.p1  ORF type:complete len:154 (+),score=32.94 GHRR01030218.1:123-584(+)